MVETVTIKELLESDGRNSTEASRLLNCSRDTIASMLYRGREHVITKNGSEFKLYLTPRK